MASRVYSVQRMAAADSQWRIILMNLMFLCWGGLALVYATHAEIIHEAIGHDSHGTLTHSRAEAKRVSLGVEHSQRAIADNEFEEAAVRKGAAFPEPVPPSPRRPRQSQQGLNHVATNAGGQSVVGRTPDGDPEPETTFGSVRGAGVDVAEFESSDSSLSRKAQRRSMPAELEWLADHQNEEGFWSAASPEADTTRSLALRAGLARSYAGVSQTRFHTDGRADLAVTALALWAFSEKGYHHRSDHYRETCRKALLWLRKTQARDGSFDGARNLHDNALATIALLTVYGLSGDQAIRGTATNALDYVVSQQVSGSGWGVGVHHEPDIESTWYGVLAVHHARLVGLDFKTSGVFKKAGAFLDMVAQDEEETVVTAWSATRIDDPAPEISGLSRMPFKHAAWVAAAVLSGHCDLNDQRIQRRIELVTEQGNLPDHKFPNVDFQYWYVGTSVAYLAGRDAWERWEKALVKAMFDHQRGHAQSDRRRGWTSGAAIQEHGSWDPIDPWTDVGGRVHSTTVVILALEIRGRYQRFRGRRGSE